MKTTIKVVLCFLLACLFNSASAQLQPGMGFPNIFGGMGAATGQGQATTQTAPVQPVADSSSQNSAPQGDIDKQKEKADLDFH